MNITIFQMDVIPGDPEANRQQVRRWFEESLNAAETDIVVLPEMWTTAYTLPELADIAEPAEGNASTQLLQELAVAHDVHIIGGSIAVKDEEKIFNRALVVNRQGELIYTYDKVHLVPMLDEPAYMNGGEAPAATFELDGVKMGVIICFDLRFPEMIRNLALQGTEVLFIPAEWPDARADHWEVLQQARALENQMYVVSSNRIGAYNGVTFAGRSMAVSPWGEIKTKGSQGKEEVLTASLDFEHVKQVRQDVPIFTSRVPAFY
ncbi:putative amidohydrolase [Salsuginibacillus halophilus]|uniref:Putative amidohydrolase n=1 Tax=Salsuginibacillus halophilus TaxID=517424 RepID=A0A2P8HQV2_9BACI|nr:carbon-nitrogen family hydrolase [Salsuginibacillus halophilus]PSL48595.1 putative amidohydrolase [Salsuginibacillus halophilus]